MRLSEVIETECLEDGTQALDAFESLAELAESYPAVRTAIDEEAKLRFLEPQAVLDDIALPYLVARLEQDGAEAEEATGPVDATVTGEDDGEGEAS